MHILAPLHTAYRPVGLRIPVILNKVKGGRSSSLKVEFTEILIHMRSNKIHKVILMSKFIQYLC